VTWLVCIVYTGSISSDVLRGAAGGIGIYNMFWVEGGILFLTVVVYYSRPSVSIRIVVLSALLSRRCWCGIGQGICVFSFSSNVHIDVDSCLCSLTERNNIFKVNSTGSSIFIVAGPWVSIKVRNGAGIAVCRTG